jgi:hypothetical protein
VNWRPDDYVKSCRKLESGLRLGLEGLRACQLGQFASPLFWSADEVAEAGITKASIIEKRRQLFDKLNDQTSLIPCKQCLMVTTKRYADVDFSKIGHVDLAATTICNLRCGFCGYAKRDTFQKSRYDALAILREFAPEDCLWDAAVDFNGGEPTLLPDFGDYIEYFNSRRIRIFLYTNAVKYSQAVTDGLRNGTIRWVCTSLDAGTPSTFKRLKRGDCFLQVVENLARYAEAGGGDGGKLAVKYIFCDDNGSADDVAGFAYAMLAIRPQEVWLTFDFEPLIELPRETKGLGGIDYSKHIHAYAGVYALLSKHGVTPVHFAEKHLAAVSQQGKSLLESALTAIEKLGANQPRTQEGILLTDFRKTGKNPPAEHVAFTTKPLRRFAQNRQVAEAWSLVGKRILLAPACTKARALLSDPEVNGGEIVGILDRDPVLQGKKIEGISIHAYTAIPELKPDVILVAVPEHHVDSILGAIRKNMVGSEYVAVLSSTHS